MSVSLENLFSMQQSIQNVQTGSSSQPVNSAVNQLLQNMFSTGDVISGKVSSMQGNVVELLLPGGQSLNAILAQNVQVNLGEQMMFAVKGMNANQMELNPLFTNTSNTTTIMKALDGAGLPVNEQNVSIVQNMMERGMSIQKDALLGMKRSVAQFPSAPIEDVVTLHSLKMPVNEANLTQLSAYKNSENQIMQPIMDMLSEVPNTFDHLLNAGESTKAVGLYKELIQLFGEMPEKTMDNLVVQSASNELNLVENAADSQTAIKYVLAKFGLDNGQIEAVLKENPSKQDVMQILGKQITNNTALTEDVLTEIFRDSVFKEFMAKTGKELSTLTPKEVANHENIDNLYENLHLPLNFAHS